MQLLWKGLMAYVARFDIDLMFGCAFPAPIPGNWRCRCPICIISTRHAGRFCARVPGPELFVDMNILGKDTIDEREGDCSLPPMLKGYGAGCQIGEARVIDRQFDRRRVHLFPLRDRCSPQEPVRSR